MEHEDKAKVKADASVPASRIAALFQGRSWWMNALMLFCGFMTFVYVPWDLFIKPVEQSMIVRHSQESCLRTADVIEENIQDVLFVDRIEIPCGFIAQKQWWLKK